jgi:RNA polymerase sigma-70 factor (ECF subfamily)
MESRSSLSSADRFAAARTAWPQLPLDEARFTAACDGMASTEHDADLFLACACACDVPGAASAFDRALLSQVARWVRRVDATPAFADEVRQRLGERLLVTAPGRPPRLAEYEGRGPLGAWVRVAALRVALDLKRERSRAMGDVLEAELVLAARPDPEEALLIERHRQDYQAALRTALRILTVRERTILRLSILDGLSTDGLGALYNVHKTTTARWVRQARARLIGETYRCLSEQLMLSEAQLHSLNRVLLSQIELRLSGLFDS